MFLNNKEKKKENLIRERGKNIVISIFKPNKGRIV